MHPKLSSADWINLFTLVAILISNVSILRVLIGKINAENKARDVCWAHGFWTANWLVWLLAWLAHFKTKSLILPDLLDDLGAILLIGFAVLFVGGARKLKTFSLLLGGLFIIDALWVAIASTTMQWQVTADIQSFGQWVAGTNNAEKIILNRTVLFAPSLCLVVVGLGLVAWSFIQRFWDWQLSALMALLTAAYAILHVLFFQADFFLPGSNIGHSMEFLFLAWRVVLVLLYSFLILNSVGVPIQFQRIITALGTVASAISTVVALKGIFPKK